MTNSKSTNQPKTKTKIKSSPTIYKGKEIDVSGLWLVNGKYYDFTAFLDRHPGGRFFLTVGQGRDCTELFQSVHSLSKQDFDPIFKKYRVYPELEVQKSQFDWSEKSDVYHSILKEVREYFDSQKLSYKGTYGYWLSLSLFMVLLFTFNYIWLTTSSPLFGGLSAISVAVGGFMFMHTASHGAASHSSIINYWGSSLWNSAMLWDHKLWMQHHVYGHHCYTGLYGKDPDLRNIAPFARKSKHHNPNIFTPYQSFLGIFILTVFPGQNFGQIWSYWWAVYLRKLFGMPIRVFFNTLLDDLLFPTLIAISFVLLHGIPFYLRGWDHFPSFVSFFVCMGITYWGITFPNHDSIEVLQNADESCTDWAELQIRHSSNFKLPYVISQMLGGMNYQIEHHLFPQVHPNHYPAISKIVQRIAKERKIPYICHDSWFHALYSHYLLLDELSVLK